MGTLAGQSETLTSRLRLFRSKINWSFCRKKIQSDCNTVPSICICMYAATVKIYMGELMGTNGRTLFVLYVSQSRILEVSTGGIMPRATPTTAPPTNKNLKKYQVGT